MDIRQLRCLVAVGETASFNGAAERLHLAQSAVSRHIQKLEDEFGIRFFERDRRAPVSPTAAGVLFLAAAKTALDQFDYTTRIGHRLGRGELGRIRLGFVDSATLSGTMAATVQAFRSERPEVTLELAQMNSDHQLAALATGDLDIGFFRPRASYPASLTVVVVNRETMLLAVNTNDPLAVSEHPIEPAALKDLTLVLPRPDDDAGFSRVVRQLEQRGGFTAGPIQHMPDLVAVLGVVGAGMGVAVVPDSLRCVQAANIVYRPLAGPALTIELMAAYRRDDASPAVRQFARFLPSVAVPGRPPFASPGA